ncbi:hypothetical protein [Kitasatospora indigofera]|uniref:hypothetical protein n=1 Tax=Kitasatospora indigofera TaxID=67307 RepID=UPI00167C66F4|nr:hypothetical protein [Kitasatospora indigofera]
MNLSSDDAAARTVTVPLTVAVADEAADAEPEVEEPPDEEHPLTRSMTAVQPPARAPGAGVVFGRASQ